MTRTIRFLTGSVLISIGISAFAQSDSPDAELLKAEHNALRAALKVSQEDVGDIDSFGRRVKWIGSGQTVAVQVSRDCVPSDDLRCIVPDLESSSVEFDEKNLTSIVLPPKTARSFLCHWVSPRWFYQHFNRSDTMQLAEIQLSPYVTIENDVLNDPSAINPETGEIYGGQIEISLAMTRSRVTSLLPGESEVENEAYSRTCIGGLISQRSLTARGLSDKAAKKFFNNKTTIRFHLRGRLNYAEFAFLFYGIRLTAD